MKEKDDDTTVSLLNFMTTPELTKWLRDNSSGEYLPAAEAADLIESLTKRTKSTATARFAAAGVLPEVPAPDGLEG